MLNVNEEEYKAYLVSKYELIPLEVRIDTEEISPPKVRLEEYEDKNWGRMLKKEVYKFTVLYSFLGTSFLFRLKPSTWTVTTNEVDGDNNKVSFSFKMYEKDPDKFLQIKNRQYNDAFINISNFNKEVENWNRQVNGMVESQFNSLKE